MSELFYKTAGCSKYGEQAACEGACGLGAGSGRRCQWRYQQGTGLTTHYGTCSPNLATCPDGVCDELERMVPSLCPQDCVGECGIIQI